ncbi:MAG TPA: xanthine dehydrogenase family protein subunit M [Acidimicrobiia bacterium]
MYPAAFDYLAPRSLDEALAALDDLGEDGTVLAGGQSLIPLMKLRLATPGTLVDINRIPGLDFIEASNGHIRIGATVRHADMVRSQVAAANHTVAAAAPWISDPLVRNLGTVCGSVAHCDPKGDWNSVMLAVRAEVVARSRDGERVIPIDDFVVDFFTNSLRPAEMVTEVRVPRYRGRGGGTYLKLERKVGDYATVGVATQLQLDDAGRISDAGIALTSVNPINTRATAAEEVLVGEEPSEQLFSEAAELASRAADPEDSIRGSAAWRRELVGVYTRRALATALQRAQA